MDHSQFILSVNVASIVVLTLFTALLVTSSKFKGMKGYAALVTFVPTVPVYLYNMSRMLAWHGLSEFLLPLAFSVNTTLMPLLWILTKANYDPDFRWHFRKSLHFIPAIVFFMIGILMGSQQRMDTIRMPIMKNTMAGMKRRDFLKCHRKSGS